MPRRAAEDKGGARVTQTQADGEALTLRRGASADPIVAAWSAIREGLRRDCGARTFDGWLRPITLGGFDADTATLRLQLPSQFMADWVQTHFAERLALAWRSVLPAVRHLLIIATDEGMRSARAGDIPAPAVMQEPAAAAAEAVAAGVVPAGVVPAGVVVAPLEPRYRFENFVVGKANEVAYNAARTLANADNVAFNPLFLHGGTGRGKTHLLHAIGHEFRCRHPAAKVIYMSAEKFMVEFVAALRANETIRFKQLLRAADLLMIDDVQFIAGKESTQEEFFHTMNEIISAGRRLVIS
ncbi:MAG: dnaA, partial [Alphaproteobacteria bacterium]|nr:dnaA [Alphaproteobacteria bacterium]